MTDNEVMRLLEDRFPVGRPRNVQMHPRQIYKGQDSKMYITYGGGEIPLSQVKRLLEQRGIYQCWPDTFVLRKHKSFYEEKSNDRD